MTEHKRKQLKKNVAYLDLIKVLLTFLVVLHHCVFIFLSLNAKMTAAIQEWSYLFIFFNQAYFMGVFFFISVLFVPASIEGSGSRSF